MFLLRSTGDGLFAFHLLNTLHLFFLEQAAASAHIGASQTAVRGF